MSLKRNSIITAALILVLTGTLRANDPIGEAIDAGTDYLLGEVKGKQVGTRKEGQVALETYALVVSEVSVNHPLIKRKIWFAGA